MGVEEERQEIARMAEELSMGRTMDVKLFAAELAGRIRARSIAPNPEMISLSETAKCLGICKGQIAKLVASGVLPQPQGATFVRGEIEAIRVWISPYMASSRLERLAKLVEAVNRSKADSDAS